jgi:hypothetical protein
MMGDRQIRNQIGRIIILEQQRLGVGAIDPNRYRGSTSHMVNYALSLHYIRSIMSPDHDITI